MAFDFSVGFIKNGAVSTIQILLLVSIYTAIQLLYAQPVLGTLLSLGVIER